MKNIVIKGWMVAIAVLVVMFGGIYLTIGTGHWSTSREGEPVRLDSGEYDPGDIRGSYSFEEIEEFFGVPVNVLFEAFMIPEEQRQPTFQIKNLEGAFAPVEIDGVEMEVGTDLVRVFTSLYSGIPYESTETTHLPESALKMLLQSDKLSDEQKTYWEAHTFKLIPAAEAPEGAIIPEEHVEDEIAIKGGTTMGELLDYGLTKEQFKEITGFEMPDDPALELRDFVTENGLDMETVKTGLENILLPTSEAPVSPTEAPQPQETQVEAQPEPEAQPEAVLEIKGSTTVGSLFDSGLTKEQFQEITGVDVPEDRTMKLKDFAEANGLDMETLKEQILEVLSQ